MNSIDAVMRVLAFCVFADRIGKYDEIAEVCHRIGKLAVFTEGGMAVPPDKVQPLFDKHAARVKELMKDPGLVEASDRALRCIDDPDLARAVLDGMRLVSHADEERHRDEANLIARAARVWSASG